MIDNETLQSTRVNDYKKKSKKATTGHHTVLEKEPIPDYSQLYKQHDKM